MNNKTLAALFSRFRLAVSLWPRWVLVLVLIAASFLGFSLAFNVALNLVGSRLLLARLLSNDPMALEIDYHRAWSPWPTRVFAKSARVRGSDANVQWQVEVDDARLTLDWRALLRQEIHVTKLRAHGIDFRLRQKIDAEIVTDEQLAALPPIAGFEAPPLREAGPPTPDIPDEEYNLWSVRIEDVEGLVRQIWVDEFHFEGEVQVIGAFFLKPKRWLWVGPAQATFLSGSVSLGDEKLLEATSGSVGCTIPAFDPRPPVGMEFFRFVSGSLSFDAEIPHARALGYYTRSSGDPTTFEGGHGALHLDGELRSGVARPLNVSLNLRELRAQKPDWLALGSLDVVAQTPEVGPSEWFVGIAPIELQHGEAKTTAVQATELRINATTHDIDLSKPTPVFDIHAELPSAAIPDLRLINRFTSSTSGLRVDGGKASIAAHFDTRTGTNQAKGDLQLKTQGMSAHVGELHFAGRVDVDAHVSRVLLDTGDVTLSHALIQVNNVKLRDSNHTISDWWGKVETRNAKFRPGERAPIDVIWTAKLESAAPVLAFSKRTPALPGWVTRLLAGGEVEASGHLRAGGASLELSNFEAQTTLLSVEGRYRQQGEATSGVFGIRASPFSVGVEIENEATRLILLGTPVEPPLKAPVKAKVRAAAKP